MRALVGTVHEPAAAAGAPPAVDVSGACDELGELLAAEPWADHLPVTVRAAPTVDGGRWVLTDDTGSLALAPHTPGLPHARSPPRPARPSPLTVEWTAPAPSRSPCTSPTATSTSAPAPTSPSWPRRERARAA